MIPEKSQSLKKMWQMSPEEEYTYMPLVVTILSHRDKGKVFSNTKIQRILLEFGYDVKDSQIRRIVWNIRQRGLINLLIANNEGYFVASTIQEVQSWVATHTGKIDSMLATLEAIQGQFEEEKTLLKSGESSLGGQMSIFDYID